MPWDAKKYLQFKNERTRPAEDLVSRIDLQAPGFIVDLGCGPGNSTQALRRRWPQARVVGLDNSAAMIAAARSAFPTQEWHQGELEDWVPPEAPDLVFANAVLHWLPNHRFLVPSLFARVASGGALAFQVPSDRDAPVRRFIGDIAEDPRWASRLRKAKDVLILEEPAVYYDALADRARSLDLWETEYHHVLDSPSAIVQWIASTGLRPILETLENQEDRHLFLSRLTDRVTEAYPRRRDGRVLFPFRRLFVVAYG